MTSTLIGFTEDAIAPLGVITLPMTVREEPRTKTLMIPFIVVKLPSAYNVIIGHPTLNKLRVVVSTYHRIMKFPTSIGVGESLKLYLTALEQAVSSVLIKLDKKEQRPIY
ncbi:hypothetical protein BHE74_00041380 [Ensete ventricosum]|nr:hypothetical protein BHE74_00041380 [Ensete ventricosum]RZR94452.1 hypothetical protein BHM03_00023136 [Ensete ventricosum]